MVAYLKAVQKMNQGKTPQNLALAVNYTGLDMELIKEISWYKFSTDGQVNVERVMDFQKWAFEKGYIDGLAKEEQLFDFSFIEYANQAISKP